jgi:hypothetical protein
MALAEFAYAMAWRSKHFPFISRFQKDSTGSHMKTVKKKIIVELMMIAVKTT